MLVEDHEIEARFEEFEDILNIFPEMFQPEYRLMLMILCVLGDIRKLLQPTENEIIKEETDVRSDEVEHKD